MATKPLTICMLTSMLFLLAIVPAQPSSAQEPAPRPVARPNPVPGIAVQPPPQAQVAPENTTTRIVPVEYASPGDLMNVLQLFGVQVIPIEKPKAVALSGAEDAVDLAEKAVQQLDVPPPPVKNVEVVVYLIVAAKDGNIPEGLEPCGPQLDPVMEQLRSVFGFEKFGLIDTLMMRGRDGSSVQASGLMPPLAKSAESGGETPSNYQVEVRQLGVQPAAGTTARISLNGFTYGMDIPIPVPTGAQQGPMRRVERRNIGISADLDVQEGQMAVVGKANISAQGNVEFVVVTAHVVPE